MYKVKFNYKGQDTIIGCSSDDTMRQICDKYANMINIDIDDIYFLYNSYYIDKQFELKLEEIINKDDKLRKEMNILVFDRKKSTIYQEKKIQLREIICPKCKENTFININNYKINLNQCQNGHVINNILFKEFNETQNINISEIKCDICKIKNKSNTFNNDMYRCNECKINICPLCTSKHKHKLINYDIRNYKCSKHNNKFIKYCKDCNENICIGCEKEHNNHNIKYFGDILANENIINHINEFRIYIDKINIEIKDIIDQLNNFKNNLELYYSFMNNIINNNDKNDKNENYQLLYNIKEFINFKNIIIKDIKEIIDDKDIKNKCKKIFNINEKMNKRGNYIISDIYIEENDVNKDVRIINSFEQTKREFKWGDNENDNEFKNEKEIKENCEIEIDNKIIPFSYFYKFNKKGNHIIKYSFIKDLTKTDFLFYGCKSLTNINLSNLNTENVTNMRNMFGDCKSLKNINLLNLNTQKVINMSDMFSGCISLANIDLSNFNTKNVTNMSYMFNECKSLVDVNLSNFDIKNVTKLNEMFSGCSSLKTINLQIFDTQNVTNMNGMFNGCSSLESIDLSNFNTQNVTDMSGMFNGCNSLTDINLLNFNTKNVTDMSYMFNGCKSLKEINLSNFNTQNVNDMIGIFRCVSLNKKNIITNDNKILNQLL